MICYLFPAPTYLFYSSEVPALLYYAQIPATVVALLFSFYAFWNGRHFLLNKLLFIISIFFSLWVISTLIAWTNIHSNIIIFIWSFFSLILGLISIFCIYFIYVFLDKKDISKKIKLIFLTLLAPIFILAPTYLNLSGFNLTNCDSFDFEWLPLKVYGTMLGVLAMMWIFILLVRRYRSSTYDFKKQIVLMGAGMELFLFSFFGMEFLATYLVKIGILSDSSLELYGLFGMVIFMTYISILMVRFKTFNIKMIATQALVWGFVILIGSQFFFIKMKINFILTGITFIASIILGFFLIRSVMKEVKQREKLEILTGELEESIKQRESLVHLVTHKVKGSFTRTKVIFASLLDGTFGEINPEIRKVAEKGLDFDNGGIETVDLVLNVANMQNGLIKYEMKNINFKNIVLEVINDKKITLEKKGLKLTEEIKEDTYNTSGDAFWLKEAINNLLENSIRYTKEGEVKVSLEKINDKVLFSIKDTGIGITEEDKKNLFTEGGRGKDSVKVNVDSTGYGLYTVKLVIEAHKGRVRVESEGAGKGSQFFIELPLS